MGMIERMLKEKLIKMNIPWPFFYKRFIDDILLILRGSRAQATEFLKLFNEIVPSIKCEDFGCIGKKVDFLDITIYKGARFLKERRLDIRVYQKPMNAYMYTFL
jgi:hypothetical protein